MTEEKVYKTFSLLLCHKYYSFSLSFRQYPPPYPLSAFQPHSQPSSVSYKNPKRLNIDRENRIVAEKAHAPIIDKHSFDKVQELMKLRTKSTLENRQCLSCFGADIKFQGEFEKVREFAMQEFGELKELQMAI